MANFRDEFQHLKIQLEEIKLATDNFGDNNHIGIGGFGKVYKGVISHSKGRSMAAIKRLDGRYGQGNTEFWREIMMLSRYTHENLVSLLGFCDEDREKILVYEHASHGSLDCHLGVTALTWMQRLRICLAATRGLSYLHDPKGTQQRVLHRDIKSSNILLDENWNAKVSDFGLSRIGPANQQHTALVSNVIGTLGYLDPLYMEMGLLTKESDVYSLGVVLFEVLCGRLCFEYNNGRVEVLTRIWKQSYKQKKLHEIIHQDLLQQMDSVSLETFSDIAYQCLRRSREKRPTMALVVEKLEIALKLQEAYEEAEQPTDYKETIQTVVPDLPSRSKPESDMLHYEGVLVDGGTSQHTTENVTLDFGSSPASNLENQEYVSSRQETHEEEKIVDEVQIIIKDEHVNRTKFQLKFTEKLPASYVPKIADPFVNLVDHTPINPSVFISVAVQPLFDTLKSTIESIFKFRIASIECRNKLDSVQIVLKKLEWYEKEKCKPTLSKVNVKKASDTFNWHSLDVSEWASLLNGETRFGGRSQQQIHRCSPMKPQQKSSTWRKGSVKVNRCHPSSISLRRRG